MILYIKEIIKLEFLEHSNYTSWKLLEIFWENLIKKHQFNIFLQNWSRYRPDDKKEIESSQAI